jgi:para-aminobenzoate synthetase
VDAIKVLIIDNFDSFTNNLWHLVYKATGIEAQVVRNDHDFGLLDESSFDFVLISPGPGHPSVPQDVGICTQVMAWKTTPILGVCLGHQLIALHAGAQVVPAPEVRHGRLSCVTTDSHWLFDNIPTMFTVIRYHSWHVCQLPQCLVPLAHADDGVLMALAHASHPHFGVQFHPESVETQYGEQLIRNFFTRFGWRPKCPSPAIASALQNTIRASTHRLEVVTIPWLEPETVVDHFRHEHDELVWLDSAVPNAEGHQTGILYLHEPGNERWIHNPYTDELSINKGDEECVLNVDLFEHMRLVMGQVVLAPCDVPFDFQGGLIGALSYEAKWAHNPSTCLSRSYLYYADRFIVFDHQSRTTFLVFLAPVDEPDQAQHWLSNIRARLDEVSGTLTVKPLLRQDHGLEVIEKSVYIDQVKRCQAELVKGESYELCLTTQIELRPPACAWSYYVALRLTNPAPFSAYITLPDRTVACSSPEKFLSVDRRRVIEAKPIKGTRARVFDATEDARIVQALRSSEKDRAENLMITDLLRHDLGANAVLGSIDVPYNRAIETYATVHQMVSTIRGQLRPGRTSVDVVEDAFPGGSMTGAPKHRSVRILADIERRERGLYAGNIGYLSTCGQTKWNVVIRTAVITKSQMSIGAGGAVVAQSDPEDEYREMLIKVFPLLRPLGFESLAQLELILAAHES